jgi:phosphoribosyl-ATP pyrophosphohydrolase
MNKIESLIAVIKENKKKDPVQSYTAKLFEKGLEEIQKKFGEESIELIIAASAKDKEKVIYEASDVIYHFLVLLEKLDVSFEDVLNELEKRTVTSGIEEKKNRNR